MSKVPAILTHDDHARGCQGREYTCTCGYDERIATALSDQKAEIERLTKALEPFAKYMEGGMDLDNHGAPLPDDQGVGWVYLTYADFRAARAALPAKGEG